VIAALAVVSLLGALEASISTAHAQAGELAAPSLASPSLASPSLASPSPTPEATETSAHSAALASVGRGDPSLGIDSEFAAWADVGIFSGDYAPGGGAGSFTLIGTDFGVWMGLGDEARLSVDWGVAYGVGHVVGSYPATPDPLVYDASVERVEARNPVISFDWIPWLGDGSRLSAGLVLAIPSAAIQTFGDAIQAGPRTVEEAATFETSRRTHDVWLASNGGWNAWRYLPERLTFALPLSVLFDLGPVRLALDGALGVAVPVLGGVGDVDGIAQAAAELYGTAATFEAGSFSMGARLSIAGYHLGASNAVAQPSIEPWVRIDARPGFVTVRGVLNVGDPFGLGNPTGVWALHVGGGIAL